MRGRCRMWAQPGESDGHCGKQVARTADLGQRFLSPLKNDFFSSYVGIGIDAEEHKLVDAPLRCSPPKRGCEKSMSTIFAGKTYNYRDDIHVKHYKIWLVEQLLTLAVNTWFHLQLVDVRDV